MQMLLKQPPPALQDRVCAFWSLRGKVDGIYSGLPKPYVELILSLDGLHHWQIDRSSPVQTYKKGWLTPLQFGPRFAQTFGSIHLIGARLKLETVRDLFGGAALLESVTPIPIESLIGSEAELLRQYLYELPDDLMRMRALAEWIEKRLSDRCHFELPSPNHLAAMDWRTDALANYYDLSPRGLRKRFRDQFGISPKLWMQLNRFDQILSSQEHYYSLADMAAAFGYTDQAHMSHEFKRFSGLGPGTYFKSRVQTGTPEKAPHFVSNG